ncbi:DNA-directed RNA polymerase subunit beta'' [Labeo rohita]|nr:DNA-directed RNA polymerase subunit beta'' [Labeo rohita]
MLKYAEKRRHYSYVTMQARIQLSVLDHNHNVGRQHDSTELGKDKYNVFHSRQSNQWVVRKLYEPTKQDFRKDLVQQVILRRLDKNVTLGDKVFQIHPSVNLPANIAPTPKPNKDNLVAQHTSRFRK